VRTLTSTLTFLVSFVALNSASGAILVYEGFDYPPGGESLVGKGGAELGYGGAKWTTSWGACDHLTGSESLSYGHLSTTGGSVQKPTSSAAMATRGLANNLAVEGETMWSSFLVRLDGASDYGGIAYGTSAVGGNGGLFVNFGWDDTIGLSRVGGGGYVSSGFPIIQEQSYLVIVEMRFQAGNDVFRLYVDPLSSANPGSPVVEKADLNVTELVQTGFTAAQEMTLDEVRIGQRYADVVPGLAVPEPGSLPVWCLFAIGAALYGFRGSLRRVSPRLRATGSRLGQ
jgi:hypothetical protein